jgi:dolichol-phosphate mannosyltransferase
MPIFRTILMTCLALRQACIEVRMRYWLALYKGVNVVNWPMSRVLMSYFASVYVRFITGIDIQDATAGFMCYKRKVLETINLDKDKICGLRLPDRNEISPLLKHGFKVPRVPIIFTDRTAGTSKMSSGIFKEAVFGLSR